MLNYCNKQPRDKKNIDGFSLIEVIVAFSVLSIAFISLIRSFPFSLSINKEAENVTVASFLAQQKIEELNSLGYNNIATGTIEALHRLATTTTNNLYYYQRKTVVTYVDVNLATSSTDLGMKKAAVDIYYTNAISKTQKIYNISTLFSQR